ncbi:MAG: CoA transferase subunit A [Thermoplasmata archaeon]|nr:MAG: CoA transferase subunit A [Thermoplasmata archaeon]
MGTEIIESGEGEFIAPDPDRARAWMREHKSRELKSKVMSEKDAVERFVKDGFYLSYDLSSMVRGPMALEREIVRQRKRNLWIAAKFTLLDTTLLVAGGCVSKIDVGFAGLGRTLFSAIENGEVEIIDWSNGALALRHLAGAMGVPFLPTRALMGTDTFKHSGAKVIEDPFTGNNICLVPAINPDVAIIHVNQCDEFGNSRVFGPSVSPVETAMASRRVIISAEEIIPTEDIRKRPGQTTIPYYLVDAVVHVPFGAHPGTVPGLYTYDTAHLEEFFAAREPDEINAYLEKYIYNVADHKSYLKLIGGPAHLEKLTQDEEYKEGYYL